MYDQFDPDLQKKSVLIMYTFTLALTFLFITLKLIAVIAWSWWWVLVPFWGPIALGLVMFILGIRPPGQ